MTGASGDSYSFGYIVIDYILFLRFYEAPRFFDGEPYRIEINFICDREPLIFKYDSTRIRDKVGRELEEYIKNTSPQSFPSKQK